MGSGKTTAIKNASVQLLKQGVPIAVITNDQGASLVDTGFIKSFNIPAEEISNGCFCCNYEGLTKTLEKLNESVAPQIVFAEAVGSCTDLIATIAKPLGIFYPQITTIVSVFADATLLSNIINGNALFINESVQYLYKKQLEEADILIVNKTDLLSAQEIETVENIVRTDYAGKIVLYQNSLDEKNIAQWIEIMERLRLPGHRQSLQIDYDVYAQGEAMLGWLDEELEIISEEGHAWSQAVTLVEKIETILRKSFVIGHLKFLIDDGHTKEKLSYTTIGRDETKHHTDVPAASKVSLLINARVEANPGQLQQTINEILTELVDQSKINIKTKTVSAFAPGYPTPRYRFIH